MARQPHGEPAAPAAGAADTPSAVENSNELNGGPQKDAHRSSYATSAPPRPPRQPPTHPPPPDVPRWAGPGEDAAVAATAAELEEALQEVSRRGARIDALTCEVAWYRHWADQYWQQLQSLSAVAAAASNQHQQQQLAAMASFQNAANQNFAAAANFANAAAAANGPPHAGNSDVGGGGGGGHLPVPMDMMGGGGCGFNAGAPGAGHPGGNAILGMPQQQQQQLQQLPGQALPPRQQRVPSVASGPATPGNGVGGGDFPQQRQARDQSASAPQSFSRA